MASQRAPGAARPLRIMFVSGNLHGGGAEMVMRRWCEHLRKSGHEIHVVIYEGTDRGNPTGLPYTRYPPRSGPLRHILFPYWLAGQVRLNRSDIVVSMLTYTNLVALIARLVFRCRVPVVISERNFSSAYLSLAEGKGGRAQWFIATKLYRFANHCIAISNPVAAELRAACKVPPDRISVIHNPAFRTAPPMRRPDDKISILFVGRLVAQKRIQALLPAIKRLRDAGINAELQIVGEGPLRPQLARQASQLSLDVKFLGWIEPWWDSQISANVLVLPSSAEGFGNVLVEAASACLPVVAVSEAAGVVDALIPGITGIIAKSSHPDELARAIQDACQLNFTPETIEGWILRFTEHASGNHLEELLRDVVAQR